MNLALPPYIILIPFAIVLLVAFFFSLINVAHLIRYGEIGIVGFLGTIGYLAVVSIVVFVMFRHLPVIDWTTPIGVFSGMITPF